MKAAEARELGKRIGDRVREGETEGAYVLLAPVLARRTPFPKLGRIGHAIGNGPIEKVDAFLDCIAARREEGGWVVIGAALGQWMARDMQGSFDRCLSYIVAADVWYGADILAERVPGPALVMDFDGALALLLPWREDENPWVRRAVGVAVHFWAKRSQGAPDLAPQAWRCLALLEPMIEEWNLPAAKGVGWALKTLGKHYPDLLITWLPRQLRRPHRAVMAHKALSYLSEEERQHVRAAASP